MNKFFLSFLLLGIVINANCQERFTDSRDGAIYRVVTINGTAWMADNLKFNAGTGSVYFNNDVKNANYGLLYDWKTAVKACPDGWRLPSGTDFRNLSNHFQDYESWERQSGGMKSFTIQLGGMQDNQGIFSEMDESAYYWTSIEYNADNAEYFSYLIINEIIIVDISREADIEDIHGTDKNDKYSVRCVKTSQ